MIYKGDVRSLSKKSITGRANKKVKDPLTPEKLQYIDGLYGRRIAGLEDNAERKAKFRKNLSNALITITKRFKNE